MNMREAIYRVQNGLDNNMDWRDRVAAISWMQEYDSDIALRSAQRTNSNIKGGPLYRSKSKTKRRSGAV